MKNLNATTAMYNEYGVHRGYTEILNDGYCVRKPYVNVSLKEETQELKALKIDSDFKRDYIKNLPHYKMNVVPRYNPNRMTTNYVIEDDEGNTYFVDTQGFDYVRYLYRIEYK